MNDIELLMRILSMDKPSMGIKDNEEYIFNLIPGLEKCKGFNQNNPWHIYDVYNHILHVIDGVDNNMVLRLSALFHDIGKPYVYKEDEKGIGHFYGHWIISRDIFDSFADKYHIGDKKVISNLIYYHDINIGKLDEENIRYIISVLGIENISLLYNLKRADLLAQNIRYHYMIDNLNREEKKLLRSKYEKI